MADPIRQLMQDAMDGDPGEEGEMQVPEYRARVFAKYEVPAEKLALDEKSEKGRYCDTCGDWHSDIWVIWSEPVKMDFKFQCDRCRRSQELR